jgi:hypothetical protein
LISMYRCCELGFNASNVCAALSKHKRQRDKLSRRIEAVIRLG